MTDRLKFTGNYKVKQNHYVIQESDGLHEYIWPVSYESMRGIRPCKVLKWGWATQFDITDEQIAALEYDLSSSLKDYTRTGVGEYFIHGAPFPENMKATVRTLTLSETLGGASVTDTEVYSTKNYISWNKGCKEVVLDGTFTPAQLKALAEHIEKNS
jgi:hypothetical protein